MEINYTIIGGVALAVILLIIYLIRRNKKDEKNFIREMNESELKPEKHDEDQSEFS